VLEDPAAATVAAVPPALLSRRIHRVASWLPALAAVWTLVLWLTGAPGAVSRTLELAGLLAATLAVAAAAGAVAAGPALLGALAADSLVSLRWTFLADAAWSGRRAAVLLGAGLAGVLVLSRDPARPRWHRERPA
jgi:hypothetical protein